VLVRSSRRRSQHDIVVTRSWNLKVGKRVELYPTI
jgi:hypothetical protein